MMSRGGLARLRVEPTQGRGGASDQRLGRDHCDRGHRREGCKHWTWSLARGGGDIRVMERRGTRGGPDIRPLMADRVEWKMGK